MRKIYLIRHGEPDFPEGRHLCLGLTDLPPGRLGRMQGVLAGEYLRSANIKLENIYCSRLERSRQTAEYIGGAVTVREGLEELSTGEWDGLDFDEIRRRWPEHYAARGRDFGMVPPDGESLEHGLNRFMPTVMNIAEKANGDAAIVSHASVMQTLLCALLKLPLSEGRKLKLPYGSVTELGYDGEIKICGEIGLVPKPPLNASLCGRLMDAAISPERVKRHCEAVAAEALRVAREMNAAGAELDADKIYFAALLHDIARTEPKHAERGAELIESLGYPEIAELIRMHHAPEKLTGFAEAAVLALADMEIAETERVGLERRFAKSREKCTSPEALSVWETRYIAARRLAGDVNKLCGKVVII